MKEEAREMRRRKQAAKDLIELINVPLDDHQWNIEDLEHVNSGTLTSLYFFIVDAVNGTEE